MARSNDHGVQRCNDETELPAILALWSFFEQRAGAQKDRMITIGSSLFAINAALLGFAFSEKLGVKVGCPSNNALSNTATGVGFLIALMAAAVILDFRIHSSKNLTRANKLRQGHKELNDLIEPLMPLSRTPPFFFVVFVVTVVLMAAHVAVFFAGEWLCSVL